MSDVWFREKISYPHENEVTMTKSPDLWLLAALVHNGVLAPDEADALADMYSAKRGYDTPVPIDVESAFYQVCDLFEEVNDVRNAPGVVEHNHEQEFKFSQLGLWQRFKIAGKSLRYIMGGE